MAYQSNGASNHGEDAGAVEALLATYLDTAAAAGHAAAEQTISTSVWRDEVRRRVAELERLGFVPRASTEEVAAKASPIAPPAQLGPYHLFDVLGRGGMGTVYRAVHQRLQRAAAVKILSASADPQALARFHREAQTLAHLHHEGIVAILDVGEENSTPWYAMELVDGPTFDRLLRERTGAGLAADQSRLLELAGLGPLGIERYRHTPWSRFCLQIVRAAAIALGHAHTYGLVHRDVKPGNLMLRQDGRVVVVDFGLVVGADLGRLTNTGTFLGSPLYAAPEHVALSSSVQPTLDVWSLGVVLCELLTGVHPFAGVDAFVAQRYAVHGDLRLWRRHLRALPHDVATVCLGAIDPDPKRRYRDGKAFADDIDKLLGFEPIAARRSPLPVRMARWVRRHPAAAVAAGFSAILAIAAPIAVHASILAAERQQTILAETAQLIGDYAAGQVPSRSAGTARMPLPWLQQALAKLNVSHVQPESRANLLFVLGENALALGDAALGEACLRECVDLREAASASAVDRGRALARLALCLASRYDFRAPDILARAMDLLQEAATSPCEVLQLRLDYCRAMYRRGDPHRAYDLLDALLRDLPANRADVLSVRIAALAYYGELKALNERIQEGRLLLDEAMHLLEVTGQRDAVAVRAHASHAHWLTLSGQNVASAIASDAAVALATDVYGDPDHLEVASIRRERAFLWHRVGRLEDCESELRLVLQIMERNLAPFDPDLFDVVLLLGKVLRDQGRFAEALPLLERRLHLVEDRAAAWYQGILDATNAGVALLELAEVRIGTGDLVGAERDLHAAIAHYQRNDEEQCRAIQVGIAQRSLGDLLSRLQRDQEAEVALREGLRELLWAVHVKPEEYVRALVQLRAFLSGRGDTEAADQVLQNERVRVRDRRAWCEQHRNDPKSGALILGNYLRVVAELDSIAGLDSLAEENYRAALPLLVEAYGPHHHRSRTVQEALDRIRGR